MISSKDLQLQYQGFLKTPFLWFKKGVFGLEQFTIKESKVTSFKLTSPKKLRLGKLVERFVSFELQQHNTIKLLSENTQIQEGKTTIGELDCLLLKNKIPIHLEIIYKFYLYDNTVGKSELEHWIGPNRRDSLIQKINKLKEKQLPLLYLKPTEKYLDKCNLKSKEIKQQVYFKAQLFVPLKDVGKEFPVINNNCIYGFYILQDKLAQFSDCKFFIPKKHNWLVEPHTNVNWLKFDDYKVRLNNFLEQKNAPLSWLKEPNGALQKFFVVFW